VSQQRKIKDQYYSSLFIEDPWQLLKRFMPVIGGDALAGCFSIALTTMLFQRRGLGRSFRPGQIRSALRPNPLGMDKRRDLPPLPADIPTRHPVAPQHLSLRTGPTRPTCRSADPQQQPLPRTAAKVGRATPQTRSHHRDPETTGPLEMVVTLRPPRSAQPCADSPAPAALDARARCCGCTHCETTHAHATTAALGR